MGAEWRVSFNSNWEMAMAKATLRFTDLSDGRVNVKAEFDPPIDDTDEADYTPAQMAALMALARVNDHETPPSPPASLVD